MADIHDKVTCSESMRTVATRDIVIEKHLVSMLTEQGVAFRVQDGTLPDRLDFVVDNYHYVIFTHGCFWHYHDYYLSKVPATRIESWLERIGKNVQHDAQDCKKLQILSWRALIVWECALRDHEKLDDEVSSECAIRRICDDGNTAQIDTLSIHPLRSFFRRGNSGTRFNREQVFP